MTGTHTQNILQRFHRTSSCEILMPPMTVNVSENSKTARNVWNLHKESISYLSMRLSYHQKSSFITWIRPGLDVLMEGT